MKLYHYTDAAAIQSILTFKKMRLTDMRYLNDSKELRYAYDLLLSEIDSSTPAHRLNPHYAELAISYARKELQLLAQGDFNQHPAYSLSFSEEGDLLSQWRSYGSYALEIDTDEWDVPIQRCNYGLNKAKKVIFNQAIESLRCIGRDLRDYAGEIRVRGRQGYMDLVKILASFKHPGFVEEAEWRIFQDERDVPPDRIKYRVRDDMLIPYAEAEIPLNCISAIRVGPMKHQNMAVNSLREYVNKLCREERLLRPIKVEHSEVPYRPA